MNEKKIDQLLNIKTRGTRDSSDKHHFRYEATPYNDLDLLFEIIKFNEDDHFVDFGSGKGRICFYINYLFNSYTYGIEANLSTYHEALINLDSFNLKYNNDDKVNFIYNYAENYPIKDNQNVFFFFNPFTIHIFKKVISNINQSIINNPRKITIILAYPILEYVTYLLDHTEFLVKDYIDAKSKKEKHNKFLILTSE